MNVKGIMLVVFIFCSLAAGAQKIIPLYEGIPPGNLLRENKEEMRRPKDGRPTLINVTVPTLTMFVPEYQNSSRSAVIISPGGGYKNLSIEDGGYDIARAFAREGMVAFVLKYRTSIDSGYDDFSKVPFMDMDIARDIVYRNAAQWNIDTNRIGLLGLSAGGHLTAMASVSFTTHRPAFSVLVYPVISFTDALSSPKTNTRKYLLGKNITEEQKKYFSPELHVTTATPPAFLIHAGDDSTAWVQNSIAYYNALLANKVPAQLLIYQKGGHGFAGYNKQQDARWLPEVIKWLSLNGFYKENKQPAAPPFWNDILAFKKSDAIQGVPAQSIEFTGSSSFTRWEGLQNYFPGYPVINRGFGGSQLTDLIRYAYDVIIPYKPKQVLIYCGENDLASPDSIAATEVLNRYKTLFGIIRQNLPGTTIDFVSIKPSPSRAGIQHKVKEANRLISAFIKQQKNARFIDVYGSMLNADGTMRKELFLEDMLHMKPEGYLIWKKIITPYLRK